MSLEQIVKLYGWIDYLDMSQGIIFKLSTARKDEENNCAYVDVIDSDNHEFIGTAIMKLV